MSRGPKVLTVHLTFRVSQEQKDLIDTACKKIAWAQGNFIRAAVVKEANKVKRSS